MFINRFDESDRLVFEVMVVFFVCVCVREREEGGSRVVGHLELVLG